MRRFAFALIAILCHAAQAQSPGSPSSRPVSLVVTSAAGTGGDIAVRLITSRLAERLKQPVVVENRVGASGVIGADYVAKAAPDGNTLLVMAITSAILSAARTDLPFDMMRDFTHVTKLVDLPLALGLASVIKANDLKEFLALVKAAPGKYTYASPGALAPQHLIGERMNQQLGLAMVHVPHRDHALAVQNLVGGHVDMMVTSVASLRSLAAAGKLKLLAITGTERSRLAPSVPTFGELGYNFLVDAAGWYLVSAPAATPAPVVARLNHAFREVMAAPEVVEAMFKNGLEPSTGTPEHAAAFLKDEIERFSGIIKLGRIKLAD